MLMRGSPDAGGISGALCDAAGFPGLARVSIRLDPAASWRNTTLSDRGSFPQQIALQTAALPVGGEGLWKIPGRGEWLRRQAARWEQGRQGLEEGPICLGVLVWSETKGWKWVFATVWN